MSETADQKRTRRRWVNLAELVAVAGVVIAALTLWNSWSERRAAQADKADAQVAATHARGRFELHGTVAAGNASIILPRDEKHELHDVRINFPTTLGVSPQDSVSHEIDRDWFARPLLRLTSGGPDDRTGLLPVLVSYAWADEDGDEHRGRGIYDIVWTTNGRFLRGRSLALTDFRLHQKDGDQKRLDAIWAHERPAPAKS